MTDKSGKPKEPLFARRARVQQQIEQQREALALQWRGLERAGYAQERRIMGFTRGFRAVLPVGALAGAIWLVRRYGPARFARPLMFGASAFGFARRMLPWRRRHHDKDKQHAINWLPIAISLVNAFLKRRRHADERRHDVARTRAAPYRGGGRHGGLRRQS